MPTSAQTVYSNQMLIPVFDPDMARLRSVNIVASATIARGTILGELTATPGTYKAYASGNSDGSQTPKLIAAYDMVTDASGNITLSGTAGTSGGSQGETFKSAPAYACGVFKTTELVGLDANAVTVMLGRYESGVLANGVIRFF